MIGAQGFTKPVHYRTFTRRAFCALLLAQKIEMPPAVFDGTLASIDRKRLVLKIDEERSMDFRITGKTQFFRGKAKIKPSQLKPGEHLSIEAREDVDASVLALVVRAVALP